MQREYCDFCHILKQHQNNKKQSNLVLNQNTQFFAFQDYDKAAQQHILVCTKQHIETALQIKCPKKLKRMKDFGLNTLIKINNDQKPIEHFQKQTKFCFHLPPHISVNHVHLHCFLLPFIDLDKQKRIFGYLGRSIQQIIQIQRKKSQNQINNQNLKEKERPKL